MLLFIIRSRLVYCVDKIETNSRSNYEMSCDEGFSEQMYVCVGECERETNNERSTGATVSFRRRYDCTCSHILYCYLTQA